jgi:aconitate hydratase
MNYLASPPLVVAYALAGTMDIDLLDEPLGQDRDGQDVYLSDVWPTSREVAETIEQAVRSEMFRSSYGEVFEGDANWHSFDVPEGDRFAWDEDSTYVRRPPFFDDLPAEPRPVTDVEGARVLALLGDSVTTDHISPAGAIRKGSPAGLYLEEHGVAPRDFNSYGSRRGNHEVMMRGTFANIRLRNLMKAEPALPEGGVTVLHPEGEAMPIYDAAMRYLERGTPLVVMAGKEYGSGSSRDWAAKGAQLLGVRAVIAESFERIHRSNLVGMGVLPLQFTDGDSIASLGLTGEEEISITGLGDGSAREVTVTAVGAGGAERQFRCRVRIDTPKEVEYFRHGGILPFVLRNLAQS